MNGARLDAKGSRGAELLRRLSRERALIGLFDHGRARVAGFYALGICLGYALAIALTRGGDRRAVIHGLVHAALVSLSWAVGSSLALSAALAQAQSSAPTGDALAALALSRGYRARALVRARTLSTALRVARWVGLPGVLLVGVGLARGATWLWALAMAPAIVVYASVLGLAVASLALFSAELAPRRPRLTLIALALGPLLIAQAFPAFPSPIQLLSWLLDQLLDSGARLT